MQYNFDEEAREIMKDILEGVAYLHKMNFIHRDIKPQNILLSTALDKKSGKMRKIAKIADFGLSAEFKFDTFNKEIGGWGGASVEGKLGTVVYMAPEQALG